MKKLLFVLLVITLASFFFVGCFGVAYGTEGEGEGEGEGKIAFASGRVGDDEIYVMNADGSNQTRLTNNPGCDEGPCFSPDGNKIAFKCDCVGDDEIYVMNADGSNQTRLTNNSAWDGSPSWGP